MALSSKEKATESERADHINTNGVVIRVYIESVNRRSAKVTMTKPHTHFNLRREIASGTNGYDRRALLLDYSRNLRNSASENVPLEPPPKIKSIQKGVRLNQPVRICSCSSSMEMLSSSTIRCRKEQVVSKEIREGNHSKKRRARWKYPPFLEKMKNMYTQLSCKEI